MVHEFRVVESGEEECLFCGAQKTATVSCREVSPAFKGAFSVPRATVEGGTKNDYAKNPLDLLPFGALEEIGWVLKHGAIKYAPYNWRKGFAWSRLLGGVLRHLFAWGRGERKDPETGRSHLAHAATGILFLLTHELEGLGTDDLQKIQ